MGKIVDALLGDRKPKQRTAVALIGDSSISMSSVREQALNGFNDQIAAIRARADDDNAVEATVVFFDSPDRYRVVMDRVPHTKLEPLAEGEYLTDGCSTGLAHAVISTVEHLVTSYDEADPNLAFLVLIITDGKENCSPEGYGLDALNALIKGKEETGKWTFVFVGCAINFGQAQKDMNAFEAGNTMEVKTKGAEVMNAALGATARRTEAYLSVRSCGVMASTNFYGTPEGEHAVADEESSEA